MVSFKTLARILGIITVITFLLVALALTLADSAPAVLHIFRDTAQAFAHSLENRLGLDLKRSYIPIRSDQAGHMLLWFTGTLIVGWTLKRHVPVTITTFFMCLISVASEFAQPIFSNTRIFAIADAAANVVGVGFAAIILYIAVGFWRALDNERIRNSADAPTSSSNSFESHPVKHTSAANAAVPVAPQQVVGMAQAAPARRLVSSPTRTRVVTEELPQLTSGTKLSDRR